MAAMSSNPIEHPTALIDQVRAAAADRQPLRIVGGDTKAFYGHPTTGTPLAMAAWSGIVSFEPTELVVTVRAGTPLAELEAALAASGQALKLIDMRRQTGVHPRLGAVDVVPFIPLGRTKMEDAVDLAHLFGRQLFERFGVPVYFYGHAALIPERRELANVRRGGYEALAGKMSNPDFKIISPRDSGRIIKEAAQKGAEIDFGRIDRFAGGKK